MLPVVNFVTLLILISSIIFIVIIKLQSVFLGIFMITICVLYIIKTWIISSNARKIEPNKPSNNNECLIGNIKKRDGFLGGGCFDIWHVYHILFWIIIGLLIPNRLLIAVIVSISWELIEHWVFTHEQLLFGVPNKCTAFFCGRFEDVIINILGYFIGSYITIIY